MAATAEKGQELMTKQDVQQFTKYVVAETQQAILKTTGQSIGGMSHAEAEMWAKTAIAAKLYPQKDKELTPSELVSRALVKGVAGSKYGLDFFESQTAFHILHDGSSRPDYKLRLWQIEASPNYRFRYEDDGEKCTGIISKLQDGKWDDMNPVSFSMADAKVAGLLDLFPDDHKNVWQRGKPKREPWVEHPGIMRLSKVVHRCFNIYCGGLMISHDKVFQTGYEGDDVETVEGADPFAVETLELPRGGDEGHSGETFGGARSEFDETLETVVGAKAVREPLDDFLELARVKFSDEDGEMDVAAYDDFLNNRKPELMNAEEIQKLTADLRTV